MKVPRWGLNFHDGAFCLDYDVECLEASHAELLEALKWFLDDERFHVAVGGNPHAVEKMLTDARAAIAKAEGEVMP